MGGGPRVPGPGGVGRSLQGTLPLKNRSPWGWYTETSGKAPPLEDDGEEGRKVFGGSRVSYFLLRKEAAAKRDTGGRRWGVFQLGAFEWALNEESPLLLEMGESGPFTAGTRPVGPGVEPGPPHWGPPGWGDTGNSRCRRYDP